ncbi:5'-nucleotidase C-terminal domain-containing protein [Flavobacterium sp. RHBU_3]|uniref:5'-nucleotidase C-terminal domain-containing protein n=1 Tax=Flavobacterium sp. RHBU_3 TaxID=3391184 RepID=UPI003984FDB3
MIFSCAPKQHISRIEGKQLPVSSEYVAVTEIEDYIKPFREHIDKDLDSVLAYCPETMDKFKTINGWQTTIGNFEADVVFDKADKLMMQRYSQHLDVALLNHGGIRSILPKGNITARNAYEIMPFENSLVVIALKGTQIFEMAQYILKEKKPHPLSGMEIHIGADGSMKSVTVQGKGVIATKTYLVATNDYLSNGGDSMTFFAAGTQKYDLDYKLRNLFIDYFKEVDTLPIIRTERIIQDK